MREVEPDHQDTEAFEAADRPDADVGDILDDRSSSLSEPEDVDDDDEALGYVVNGARGANPQPVQKTLEVDSEAETERLEESPQKLRLQADSTGRTPSKLRKAAGVEDELSEPPSPLPAGPGAASSTSTVETAGKASPGLLQAIRMSNITCDANAITTGQKRKRSDAEDSPLTSEESEVEQSPRKRSHALATHPLEDEVAESTEPNGLDDAQDVGEIDVTEADIAEADDTEIPAAAPAKGVKGKRGRKPGRKPKVQEDVEDADIADIAMGVEADEAGVEVGPKSEEELKHKGEASSSFEDLAKQFTAFRQRLVNESLASVEHELQLLNQADCMHPEYLRQVLCIDDRRAKQVREAKAFYSYRMQAVRERTLGERAQLHSQYFQTARELRENMLYELGEDWYGIQKERRQQHQEGEERFLYKLPSKKSAQIKQQAKYNQEVSVLSGVAKYVGFPAAPNISGVEGSGLEDDFKAMRVSTIFPGCFTYADRFKQIPRRMQQPVQQMHSHQHQLIHPPQLLQQQRNPQQQPQQVSQPPQNQQQQVAYVPAPHAPPPAPSERQAHDQFLEQNAWARPQQSVISTHATPNFTHTPDWADQPPGARHIMRNLTGPGQRTGSPFATPVSGKRPAGFADGPDSQNSAFAAPPSMSKTPAQGISTGSPLQVSKHRQNGGHTGERELTGFRNISNISSTSTIDAPLSAEKNQQEKDRTPHHEGSLLARYLPGLHTEHSAPGQAFDTSQLHRHPNSAEGGPNKDVYASHGFRPAEGSYGTPTASLLSGRAPPPSG